jgi:anti-sigma regulatory factor (Ser/Thr protein kinase)
MEAGLIDSWIPDADAIPMLDDASVSLVRERIRQRAQGLPPTTVANMVLVGSELAQNQLKHAESGLIAVRSIERDGVQGIEIVAGDQGEGIEDPKHAFGGHGQSRTGLGIGLSSVRNLSEELDVDIRLNEGLCIWARAFASPVTRRREVGIFGKPHPSEAVSGDLAVFVRTPKTLALAMVDGLGHGLAARAPAMTAIRCFAKEPELADDLILADCHAALHLTRGAVMGIAQINEKTAEAHLSAIGNITIAVSGRRTSHRFEGSSFVVGVRRPLHRANVEDVPVNRLDAVVLFADGLSTRTSLDKHRELLLEAPVVAARELARIYGRADDDVTVLVAR